PGTVQFNTTKERLYHFEKENPSLDLLLKTLLRAYEGIFDQPVFISEIQVAQLMKTDADRIMQMLLEADRTGVIEYIPRKDKPQLQLLRPRMKAGDLQINMELYKERKENFKTRVNQMISFVNENAECRGRMIGLYFGDKEIRDCGICDNCLSRKNNSLTNEEFQNIAKSILEQLSIQPLPAKELTKQWAGMKRDKAWKVIEFLQSENTIEVDMNGMARLRNSKKS
ncbi:MAG TPA: RecQ family zinc-binding domain-containing protein, partial [Chitinophagaceae bacterium]|nr:RecQ family zinc-binding domain-containing protein [Chitinophagaceae bacterium]